MKVRIVSDGINTHVTDAETGQPISKVTSVVWEHAVERGSLSLAKATITTILTELDVVTDAQVLTVCPQCKRSNLYSGPVMERRIETTRMQDEHATYLPTCEHEEY